MILLTGAPNTGKSTAISTLITLLGRKRCKGFYTSEILEGNKRVGFMTHTLSGKDFIFAHIDLPKAYAIEEFGVDIGTFEKMIIPELRSYDAPFLIIDEIGPMQLYSKAFRSYLEELSASDKKVIATICKEDDEFTAHLKEENRDTLYELNEENRDQMPFLLAEAVNKDDEEYLSKLALSEKYHKEPERFMYQGDHIIMRSTHDIRMIDRTDGNYSCTCDYYQKTGTCSHIMAVIRNATFWKYEKIS